MKISEILKKLADLVDTLEQDDTLSQELIVKPEEEQTVDTVQDILKLAGVTQASTTPEEHYFPLTSAYPAGDDMHHSKNPADMRSDSISLYPAYSAKPKE